MSEHTLKTDPEVHDAVRMGMKTCEIRKNDRSYAVGDTLILRRTEHTGKEMAAGAPLIYSAAAPCIRTVTHILRGYGLAAGWVIMSIKEPPTAIEKAAMHLLKARGASDAAKAALKAYRQKHGSCEIDGQIDDREQPCYAITIDQDQWCKVCQGSQPLWQAKVRATNAAGAALRSLMVACRKQGVQA